MLVGLAWEEGRTVSAASSGGGGGRALHLCVRGVASRTSKGRADGAREGGREHNCAGAGAAPLDVEPMVQSAGSARSCHARHHKGPRSRRRAHPAEGVGRAGLGHQDARGRARGSVCARAVGEATACPVSWAASHTSFLPPVRAGRQLVRVRVQQALEDGHGEAQLARGAHHGRDRPALHHCVAELVHRFGRL